MQFQFVATGCVPREREAIHIAHTATLGLSYVQEKERPPLAVVGGGPSILKHVDELRAWQGDVWACGSAFRWCADNGINATFFCIDPQAETAHLARGASHAILCTSIAPETFAALKGAHVEIFDLIHEGDRSNHGPTTVTASPELALRMGYRDVSYFGTESSFATNTHAYHNEATEEQIIVSCNGKSYLTHPAYLLQAEYLATMMRLCPLLKNRSGGLLGALIAEPCYDITHGTLGLHRLVA